MMARKADRYPSSLSFVLSALRNPDSLTLSFSIFAAQLDSSFVPGYSRNEIGQIF